jgi:adenosine deaminase CECR1
MPKGALLHCHFGATVDMPKLASMALENPLMHVRIAKRFSPSTRDLDEHQTLELPTPSFLAMKVGSEKVSRASSLFDDGYNIEEYIPMRQARDNFPAHLGGQQGFDKWVYKSLTIDTVEAYQTHSSVTKASLNQSKPG